MQSHPGSKPRSSRIKSGPARFARLSTDESTTAQMLSGCPVVTSAGQRVGTVDHLMVDITTHQLRYVVLARRRNGAVVAVPWQALYFDAEQGSLVFYTLGQ